MSPNNESRKGTEQKISSEIFLRKKTRLKRKEMHKKFKKFLRTSTSESRIEDAENNVLRLNNENRECTEILIRPRQKRSFASILQLF